MRDENARNNDSRTLEELAAAIAQGDKTAEVTLHRHLDRGIKLVVRGRSRSDGDADDIVQSFWMTAIQSLRAGKLQDHKKVKPYLRRMAINKATEFYRRDRERPSGDGDEVWELSPDDFTPGDSDPISSLLDDERDSITRQVIRETSNDRDRRVLWEYYVLERDRANIGFDLDLTPAQFDRVIHRARTRFRKLLTLRRPDVDWGEWEDRGE